MNHGIPYRELGKSGEKVSIIGVGGFHLGRPENPAEAIAIVRAAIDHGINFMDCAWDYHDGESEHRLGDALKDGYRERAFLMTKADGRTKKAAKQQLEQSLQRLHVDHLDLWQLHEVIRFSDVERIFAVGGAIEAMVEARDEGKVRFLGFTGHKDPAVHLRMLAQDFPWDTVQMPLNVLDAHFRSFTKQVLPVLVARNIGVLGMKPFSDNVLLNTHTVTAIEALHYAMSLPTDVVITGMEKLADLEQAIAAATSFRQFTDAEMAALLARTAAIAQTGEFERYKTTPVHDSTAEHPEWLEAA